MRRLSIATILILSAAASAHADDADESISDSLDADYAVDHGMADQEISAGAGIASGGGLTPGGMRMQGRYLYQLSDVDWFDGSAAFTFGGDGGGCVADGVDLMSCDHAVLDGFASEVSVGIRRRFPGQGRFIPYARAAVGVRVISYSRDQVFGMAVPLTVAAGVRTRVAPGVAIGGEAAVEGGLGWFDRGLGRQSQLGFAISGLVEFRLR